MDKMTHKKLIEFLKKEVRIDDRKINDIRILEKFSFVTVPFKTAELILDAFKQKKRGKKPIIEMADKAKK
jgi:ATP-dependent RNA helicase DeaD